MLQNLKCNVLLYLRMCNPPDVNVRAAKHYIASYALCLCKQCNASQTFVTFASVISKVGYQLPTNMASPDHEPPRHQYDCVCLKYGSGKPHKISHTAWYQHLASACTEEEHQCIQTARLLGDRIASPPPLTKPSSIPDHDYSVPPSVRRAEACQGLAKRARENHDPNEYVGRWKCARVRVQQPINLEAGPSNYGDQVSILCSGFSVVY